MWFSVKVRKSDNGMVRPCSRPSNKRCFVRGTKDKEHARRNRLS